MTCGHSTVWVTSRRSSGSPSEPVDEPGGAARTASSLRAARPSRCAIRRRLASTSASTRCFRSTSRYFIESRIATHVLPSVRCDCVRSPERTPAIIMSTMSPSKSATTQWIGLTNRNSPSPQRIVLGKEIDSTAARTRWPRTSAAGAPGTALRTPTHSPFGVEKRFSSPTMTPCARANPSAAFVGRPDASNAALTGGPVISCTVSGCLSRRPRARIARRLGVPKVSMFVSMLKSKSGRRRPASSSLNRARRTSFRAPSIIRAGISSVPISRRNTPAERDLGRLEVVLRELDFFLQPDVAVTDARSPFQIEHVVDAVQEHADALAPVSDLRRDRRELQPSRLLEVSELADLHPVHQNLPADAGRPQRGGFPVVLVEPDVVLPRIDPEGGQRLQIEVLHVQRRRLEDDLELVVAVDAGRGLAVAPRPPPARRRAGGPAPPAPPPHTGK